MEGAGPGARAFLLIFLKQSFLVFPGGPLDGLPLKGHRPAGVSGQGDVNFEFHFEPENSLCIYRLSGRISVDGVLAGYAAARQDAGWSERYDFLTVMDHVKLGDMSPEEMGELVRRMRERDIPPPSHPRRSAVVCNDPLSQAILTYWEHTAPERELVEERMFRFEDEARQWLRAAREADAAAGRSKP